MNVARQVLSQLTEKPSVFTQGGKNLYQVLSVLPEYGVGSRVVNWQMSCIGSMATCSPTLFPSCTIQASTKVLNNPGLKDSYYEVTKVKLKPVSQ